jgi:hypothetical protein
MPSKIPLRLPEDRGNGRPAQETARRCSCVDIITASRAALETRENAEAGVNSRSHSTGQKDNRPATEAAFYLRSPKTDLVRTARSNTVHRLTLNLRETTK